MITVPVYTVEGKESEKIELKESLFDGIVNTALLHQVIVMYQANQRQGTVSTKDRGEVSGGGKKPWRQKGTGRARAGSIRSPLWRHGGVTFGPKPRDFSYDMPRRMKLEALKSSINDRMNSKAIIFVEDIALKDSKTKAFAKMLAALKIKETALVVTPLKNKDLIRISRNIPTVSLIAPTAVNAYDVLRYKRLVIAKTALKDLIKRFKDSHE